MSVGKCDQQRPRSASLVGCVNVNHPWGLCGLMVKNTVSQSTKLLTIVSYILLEPYVSNLKCAYGSSVGFLPSLVLLEHSYLAD